MDADDADMYIYSLRIETDVTSSYTSSLIASLITDCNFIVYKAADQRQLLASCLIYAWALPAHPYSTQLSIVVWVRSFIEPDLFDNNVPFDNTTPIYLINVLWKLGLGLWLDLESHYLSIFTENNENEHLIFREFHGR